MVITETFNKLEYSKKQRIIRAALHEFAENGFQQASTNRIVKEAEIGKGMLFYYFNNKDTLFQYLIKYCIEIISNEYFIQVDLEPDFIERLRRAAYVKMRAYSEHPEVFNFMGSFMLTDEYDMPSELNEQINKFKRWGYALMYENVDKTMFRDDVDMNKAFQLIKWSIEGYENDLISRFKGKKLSSIQLDSYWEEFYEYLDILKKIYYR